VIGKTLRIRYEIVQSLYDGPIFALYTARDKVQNRDVHVRVVKPPYCNEEDFVEALRKAVQKTSSLLHPGLERIWEVDEDDGTVFLVGDATPGSSLAERIKKLAPFSVPVSVSTAIGICEAMSAVHSSFQVHGDVSPHHVCVTLEGEARLQMAGIWEAYSTSASAGAVVLPNLAPYLAPEISRGGMPSPASDVFWPGANPISPTTRWRSP
jgi:eukaryotic-like serine/threonine-protein kinase